MGAGSLRRASDRLAFDEGARATRVVNCRDLRSLVAGSGQQAPKPNACRNTDETQVPARRAGPAPVTMDSR